MKPIFIVALHRNGVPDDSVGELIVAAKAINPEAKPTAIAFGFGAGLDSACACMQSVMPAVWKVAHETFAEWNAEAIRPVLASLLPPASIVMLAHEHFSIDLAPGLSVKRGVPYVSDVVAVEKGATLIRQEFNGQFNARMECDLSKGAVITVRPGAFKGTIASSEPGEIVDKSDAVREVPLRRRYLKTISAPTGDVDITKQTVLVSVGRGIQEEENITLAQELADALGGAVSCSRPVVDAKWLDKSRQVGSSGATVSPKVYLALGISGSFQHMAGLKGAPLLVAVNKNPAAPIFQFADIGIVDDILEFMPALTERVREVLAAKGSVVAVSR